MLSENRKGFLLVLSFFLLADSGSIEEKILHVKKGPVKGYISYAGEHAVYSFKNIPYAKPPVGNLRFQLPEEPEEWFSERELQNSSKIRCSQNSFYEDDILPDEILGQEDCLFLDVYVRKIHDSENASLPVLVYFHGGQFRRGSKEDHGPDYLLRYNDIILVVPNYRLGILGFLSLQDKLLPGNLGIWDQIAALKWVSQNIERFGGDPKRVTIAGHEAGAVSVGLHVLARASHDYFQQALSASGTVLHPGLVDIEHSPRTAYTVVDSLGCSTSSSDETFKCLKNVPVHDILKLQGKIRKAIFLPTVDPSTQNAVMPYPPKTLYERRYQKDVNFLIGFTENEASYEVSREYPRVLKYLHLDKMIHHFLKPYFKNAPNFEIIATAAKYHYLRGLVIPSFESLEPYFVKMMSDFLYGSPVEQMVKLHLQKKGTSNIFVYKYMSSKNENYCGLENRICHGNEFYVFNASYPVSLFEQHPEIQKMVETIAGVWGNFIISGNPDAEGRWKPIESDHDLHYAEISDTVEYKSSFESNDGEFWMTLVSELDKAQNTSEEESNLHSQLEYTTLGSWGAAGMVILCGVLCIALIGLVVITKRRTLTVSVVHDSSYKDVKYINT